MKFPIAINRTLTRVVLKLYDIVPYLWGYVDRTLTRVVLKLFKRSCPLFKFFHRTLTRVVLKPSFFRCVA